jgi:hypothetical protein
MHKVIGYICLDEKAPLADARGHLMIVSDTEMFERNENINQETCKFKKIRGGEIVEYMEKGVHCSFDEESYKRFYPIAQSIFQNPQSPEDFDKLEVEGDNAKFCSLGFAPKNI